MPGRNSQVARIYAVLDILEGAPQGLTVTEIWSRLQDRGHETVKRTVYRDLEALNQAGFPTFPTEDPDTDKLAQRWRLERIARISPQLVLTSRELMALYLARGMLIPLKDTPFYRDLVSVFTKLDEKLSTKARKHFELLSSEIHFEPGPRWGLGVDPDILDTVHAACSEGQLLTFIYASVNSQTRRERRIGPHYLYFAKGSIYLVGEDLEDGTVKVFGVPRIGEARMLDDVYEGERTDPAKFFGDTLGVWRAGAPVEVRMLFSKVMAPYVKERSWHHSQRVVSREDGTAEMTLEVAVTPELVQWVLGFGADAIVVGPSELIDSVLKEVDGMAARYRERAA